jgi:hypothetical protein
MIPSTLNPAKEYHSSMAYKLYTSTEKNALIVPAILHAPKVVDAKMIGNNTVVAKKHPWKQAAIPNLHK